MIYQVKFLLLTLLLSTLGGQYVDISLRFTEKSAPTVGKGMKIEALVKSETRRLLPVKLFVVRDGFPFEVSAKLESEENNDLVYSALVPSPVKELVVIAYLILENGKVTRSKPLTFRRKCIQKDKLEPTVESLEKIPPRELVALNEGLVLDNDIYSNLIKQIETLIRLTDK